MMAVILCTVSCIVLVSLLIMGLIEGGWDDAPPFVKPFMLASGIVLLWLLVAYSTSKFDDVTLCTSSVVNVVFEPVPGRTFPDEVQVVYDRDSHDVVGVNRLFGRILAKGTVMTKKRKVGGWNLGVHFDDDPSRWVILEVEDSESKGGQR